MKLNEYKYQSEGPFIDDHIFATLDPQGADEYTTKIAEYNEKNPQSLSPKYPPYLFE